MKQFINKDVVNFAGAISEFTFKKIHEQIGEGQDDDSFEFFVGSELVLAGMCFHTAARNVYENSDAKDSTTFEEFREIFFEDFKSLVDGLGKSGTEMTIEEMEHTKQ